MDLEETKNMFKGNHKIGRGEALSIFFSRVHKMSKNLWYVTLNFWPRPV